jgi:Subtilase family
MIRSFVSWFRGQPSGRRAPKQSRRERRARLGVESLENRDLLSTIVIPSPYSPFQIRSAYGFNNIAAVNGTVPNGAGQTIAIVNFYDDPTIYSDVDAFDTMSGIFGRTASQFLTVTDQNGNVINPANTTVPTQPASLVASEGSSQDEQSLDVEWAHSLAPGANIVLVIANGGDTPDLATAMATAAKLKGVSVVSMSLGFPTQFASDSLFTTPPGHQGVTFLAATGDSGSTGTVGFPAASPNVVAVGGTSLDLNSDFTISEIGWDGSGGGYNPNAPAPAYQFAAQKAPSVITPGYRTTPDVAFDADPNTGVNIVSDGVTEEVGGTSLATPCWAALIAITNEARALKGLPTLNGPTETLPLLYDLPSTDFNAITPGGSNGFYTGGTGYNEVTGLGSPIAPSIVTGLDQSITVAPDGHTLYYITPSGNLDRYNTTGWHTIETGVQSFKLQPTTSLGGLLGGFAINVQFNGPYTVIATLKNGKQVQLPGSGTFNGSVGNQVSPLIAKAAIKVHEGGLTIDGSLEGNNDAGFVALERDITTLASGNDGVLCALIQNDSVTQSTLNSSYSTLANSGALSIAPGEDGAIGEPMQDGSVTGLSTVDGLSYSTLTNSGVASIALSKAGIVVYGLNKNSRPGTR